MSRLRSFLRDEEYNSQAFLQEMKIREEEILDFPLFPEKYNKAYEKEFLQSK